MPNLAEQVNAMSLLRSGTEEETGGLNRKTSKGLMRKVSKSSMKKYTFKAKLSAS